MFFQKQTKKKQNQTELVRECRVVPNVRLWRQENESKRHEIVSKNTQKKITKQVCKAIVEANL